MRYQISLSALVFCLLLLSNSCKSNKYTPETPSPISISYGSGGGITGAVTEYLLCENGQLFMLDNPEENWDQLKRVSKQSTRELIEKTLLLGWDTLELNDPGNYYYFIRLQINHMDKKIVWGRSAAPAAVLQLYTELNQVIRK